MEITKIILRFGSYESLIDMLNLRFKGDIFGATPMAYRSSQAGGSNQNYSCWPIPQPQQLGIRVMSETYTTGHSSTGSLMH